MEVHRGEVFYADLSPVVGSEQGGVRPVLIVQNEIGNRHSPTVIAAAITSRLDKARLPTHINIRAADTGLAKDSVVLLSRSARWTNTACGNEPGRSPPPTRNGWIRPWTSAWGLPPTDSNAPAAGCGRGVLYPAGKKQNAGSTVERRRKAVLPAVWKPLNSCGPSGGCW